MRENKALPVKPEMEEVHERLDAWRRAKKYASSPIPASLWDAAVELAKAHSVHEVSRSLHLDYNQLKKRVQAHLSQNPSVPRFVELDVSAMSPGSECIVEGERADGARMRLSVRGALDAQMVEIAKAFWRVG